MNKTSILLLDIFTSTALKRGIAHSDMLRRCFVIEFRSRNRVFSKVGDHAPTDSLKDGERVRLQGTSIARGVIFLGIVSANVK